MIITRWINVRIGAIVLAAVLLQVTFFSYLEIFGTTPDFVVVVVAVIGLLGGAVIGAVIGFAAGMLLDISLLETLGVSSLVLLSVGYLAGRYRESFEIDSPFAPAAVTGALAFLASAGFTALQLTLGVERRGQRRGRRRLDHQGLPRVPPRLSDLSADSPRASARRSSSRSAPARRSTRRRRRRAPRACAASPGFLRGRRQAAPSRRAPGSRLRRAVAGGQVAMSFGDGSWNKDRRRARAAERRFAILGGIALIAFGVILFRLWYLQVLSGDRYLAEAQGNRVREVTVQAPRGEILDRDGEVIVGNRTALALQVRTDELPEDAGERKKVLKGVSEVTGMSLERSARRSTSRRSSCRRTR